MSDLYSRLTSAGSVDVLGDAAMKVEVPPNPVKYRDQEFK